MTPKRLDEILDHIPRLKIAVVGDYFLDKYLITDPTLDEPSIETGLTARQVVEIRKIPGAAGTVTNNLTALGVGRVDAVGFIGNDGQGFELLQGLTATGVDVSGLIQLKDRFTPTYIKPMVKTTNGEVELERIDIKNRFTTSKEIEHILVDALWSRLHPNMVHDPVNAVIIADQISEKNCGVITEHMQAVLGDMATKQPQVVFFADSRLHIGEFSNVIIKPNKFEAAHAISNTHHGDVSLDQAKAFGRLLAARNGKTVFVTVGDEGILACTPTEVSHIPAFPAQGPVDIVGAGDSTSAGIVCALCAGASPAEAAFIGNLCANVTIHKLGTTGTATPMELRAKLATELNH